MNEHDIIIVTGGGFDDEYAEKLRALLTEKGINSALWTEEQYMFNSTKLAENQRLIFFGSGDEAKNQSVIITDWAFDSYGCRIGWEGNICVITACDGNLTWEELKEFSNYCKAKAKIHSDIIIPSKNKGGEMWNFIKGIFTDKKNESVWHAQFSLLVYEFLDNWADGFLKSEECMGIEKLGIKIPLSKEEKNKCKAIIHIAAVVTGSMGIVPIGPADTLMITPAQIAMIISIGRVFGIQVYENIAKSIIAGFALSVTGRMVAATLLNFIPVAGWIIKGGTAAVLTETIGWAAVFHFYDVREEGKKEIYAEASIEYEDKLRNMAEEFLKKETVFKSEMAEFTQLINGLTRMMIKLSSSDNAGTPDVMERVRVLEGLIERLMKLDREK